MRFEHTSSNRSITEKNARTLSNMYAGRSMVVLVREWRRPCSRSFLTSNEIVRRRRSCLPPPSEMAPGHSADRRTEVDWGAAASSLGTSKHSNPNGCMGPINGDPQLLET